jgi:Uncharacterized protein with a bacterial SH3 domain homologue
MPYIISAKELIKQFQTMYREHWAYIWGKAEKGCVDCSGAFVYAFRQYGISYPHGSNAIARKCIVGDMMPISAAKPGMAAFKLRSPGEDGYDLPEKYRSGTDKNDYYHVGLVDEDPEYVLNAKGEKSGFCRDKLTKANGWDCVAYLKDVEYEGDGKMEMAKVVLPAGASGSTVNMRRTPSRSSDILTKVPVGADVQVLSDSGQWCQITWGEKTGYMMSNYLEYTGQGGESDTITAGDREQIDRALTAMEQYARGITEQIELIGSILGRG